MITRTKNLFNECWDLYCAAFPLKERRPLEYQLATLKRKNYRFEALLDGDTHVGLIGWWELKDVRYIEHIAIFPHLRGQKYGERALQQFIEESPKKILLEVEPPEDEIGQRRIEFYLRQGFVLNDYEYFQPSYHGKEPVKLLTMTYPEAISEKELERFKTRNFPIIYFRAQKL